MSKKIISLLVSFMVVYSFLGTNAFALSNKYYGKDTYPDLNTAEERRLDVINHCLRISHSFLQSNCLNIATNSQFSQGVGRLLSKCPNNGCIIEIVEVAHDAIINKLVLDIITPACPNVYCLVEALKPAADAFYQESLLDIIAFENKLVGSTALQLVTLFDTIANKIYSAEELKICSQKFRDQFKNCLYNRGESKYL